MKLLAVAGIGVGAYVLYESGLLSKLTGGALSPNQSAPPTPTGPASTPAPPAAQPTWQRVLAAAGGGNPALSFDTWNFWYGQTTGVPGPDPDPFVGAVGTTGRDRKLQVADWWSLMKQWQPGLQGFRRPRFDAAPPRNPRAAMPMNPRDPWAGTFN